MVDVIFELSIVIGIAAILALCARAIRQPPIIAYLIAGILAGPLFFDVLHSTELIQLFAHLGVAFLLFIVGLSLDFKVLKEVGPVSLVASVGTMGIVSIISFFIALGFGFTFTPALYLAAALAFSSTVVVVKLLSDKREIDTLHGRIALGILIVEDFFAAIMLMAIPILGSSDFSAIFLQVGKAIILVGMVFVVGMFILPRLFSLAALSQEVLFLASVAWALLVAILFHETGFSLEIGALLAGMTLATSKYALEISGKVKGLRDFFVVLFFVYFGSLLTGPITPSLIAMAVAFSLFILIGKPIIVMGLMRLFGYKKRTNFFAGIGLAQISEFSLVLLLLGYTLGALTASVLSLGVLIAVITIALSSYSLYYSHTLFNKLERLLGIFEGGKSISPPREKHYQVFLFGYHRIGYKVLEKLKKMHVSILVIDYNPKVVLALGKEGVDAVYGDASNEEFLREIQLDKANIVISTIPDLNTNRVIEKVLNKFNKEAVFLATTEQPRNALELYEQGIDYVIVPHHLGGDFVADLIAKFKLDKDKYKNMGKEHAKTLRKRKDKSSF